MGRCYQCHHLALDPFQISAVMYRIQGAAMVRFGPVFDTEQLEGSEDSGGWWE